MDSWNELYLVFADNLDEASSGRFNAHLLHIICEEGSLDLDYEGRHLCLRRRDFAILYNPGNIAAVRPGENFKGEFLYISNRYITGESNADNFNVPAMTLIILNPILHLSEEDFQIVKADLELLKERMRNARHRARKFMIESVYSLHVYDLHDIIMRELEGRHSPRHSQEIVARFVEMLRNGDYMTHRDLHHYASAIPIADAYLTQVVRSVTGKPATYWIELFTAGEIYRLVRNTDLPFSQIAERLNFSSLSHFSRFVTGHFGKSPSMLRKA